MMMMTIVPVKFVYPPLHYFIFGYFRNVNGELLHPIITSIQKRLLILRFKSMWRHSMKSLFEV